MIRRTTGMRPSPAIVVAIVALVAAVAGTAVAGPGASTSALTKSKVKKIAKKQINKLAPGLSVAHANTADTATTANKATEADNLTTQTKLDYQALAPSGPVEIFNNGNLILTASCAAGPAVELNANTTVDNASIQSYGNGSDTNEDDFDTGTTETLSDGDEERDVVYTTPGGQVVVFQYAAAEGTLYGGAANCFVKGLLQEL